MGDGSTTSISHPGPINVGKDGSTSIPPNVGNDGSTSIPPNVGNDGSTSIPPNVGNDGSTTSISPLGLTDVGNDKHGATEVVKYLLKAVGREIVSFQRNTHVSYMVAERARDIIKDITGCINTVETTTDSWESYEKYSEAIEPLEKLLFDLLGVARDEKQQYSTKTDSTTECIAECILLPESWENKRTKISDLLNSFDTSQEFIKLSGMSVTDTGSRKDDRQNAQFHDDKTLLEEMTTQIQAILFEDPNKFPTCVNGIKESLDTLQQVAISDPSRAPAWLMKLTIKTSMLIEGVAKILKAGTASIQIKNRLKSKEVWEPALALINFLIEKKAETDLPPDADAKYQAFRSSISGTINIGLPGEYAELIKKVGQIRRPFQAQAITVVKLCHILAVEFSKIVLQSTVTIENFNSLDTACKKTLAALGEAISATTDAVTSLKSFNISTFDSLTAVTAFNDAQDLIRESFTSLSLVADWTANQNKLSEAVKNDKKFVTDLQAIATHLPDSTPNKVKVTVTIEKKGSTPKTTSVTVEAEETTRLSALRWSVAEKLDAADIKLARTAGTFFKASDTAATSALDVHSTLKENPDAAGKNAALKLVFG